MNSHEHEFGLIYELILLFLGMSMKVYVPCFNYDNMFV